MHLNSLHLPRAWQFFSEPSLEVHSVTVIGHTVEVTVRLIGAKKITVILKDVNNDRQSKNGM